MVYYKAKQFVKVIMLKVLYLFFALTLFAACGPYYVDYFPYHNNGCRKPTVVLLPFRDCSSISLTWDITEELTEELHARAISNGTLYVIPHSDLKNNSKELNRIDFFDNDLSYAQGYSKGDFLVAIELIEHQWVPYVPGKIFPLYPLKQGTCNSVLSLKTRIKVIDIRNNKQSVIALEVINSNHMFAMREECIDYKEFQWKSEAYTRTPFAIAHKRLIKDLVNRLEYVICSRQ